MQYLLAIIAIPSLLLAQAQFRKVDPQLTHERFIAIVPMVGAGTAKNPIFRLRRPHRLHRRNQRRRPLRLSRVRRQRK